MAAGMDGLVRGRGLLQGRGCNKEKAIRAGRKIADREQILPDSVSFALLGVVHLKGDGVCVG